MISVSRDEFSELTKRILAARVANRCSNPDCRAQTSGPQIDDSKAVNVGVAAHITAAALGGPRYDPTLSSEQRSDIFNGVWLCQNCAKLVDNDPNLYSADILRKWKQDAEKYANSLLGKTASPTMQTEIDKWVNLNYIEEAGIAARLREQGYRLYWASANQESELIDLKDWEVVLIDQPDGSRVKLKIRDHPAVGGYLILLKKRQTNAGAT